MSQEREDVKFCAYCGTGFPEEMTGSEKFQHMCGTRTTDGCQGGGKFCSACGISVDIRKERHMCDARLDFEHAELQAMYVSMGTRPSRTR